MRWSWSVWLVMIPLLHYGQAKKVVVRQPKMGALFTIQTYATDSVGAVRAAERAFAAVDSLNGLFSDYLPDSELSRLSRMAGSGRWVPVSAALFDILRQSKTAASRSKGTFDITTGAVVRLWREARKTGQRPTAAALRTALGGVGPRYVRLNETDRTVKLPHHQTQLDLGGIGKGYAARVMLAVMQRAGYPATLCDAAGNMALGAAPPGRAGWSVGVELPDASGRLDARYLTLADRAVSTSGSLFQFVEIDGTRYSHIVDPRTGLGLTHQRQVTVLAADAATADWLSTACTILPVRRALALARREGAECLILESAAERTQAGQIRRWQTAGFP
jgi:thiamine biosynthesis lipoprotein